MIDRHHLLECILWPNGDGTFRKIINRAKRLEELGIYDDYKLTIPIEHRAHSTMHRAFEKGTEYEMVGDKHPMYGVRGKDHPASRLVGEKNGMYGKGYLISGEKGPMYGKGYLISGEKNPMYGKSGVDSPRWKGDNVGPHQKMMRARKEFSKGNITKEELRKVLDEWNVYQNWYRREKRANRI